MIRRESCMLAGLKRRGADADECRMGGMRALIASIGASISLVAGAALSLLVVSFVFAYDGLGGTTEQPTTQAALLVEGPTTTTAAQRAERRSTAAPLVIEAAPPKRVVAANRPVAGTDREEGFASRPRQLRSVAPIPAPIDPKAPAGSNSSGGADGVRDLGDSVSSAVQDTGKAAGAVTEPLGPPVTQAVQKVLDLLGDLLKNTTGAVAGALDKTLGK